jgi:hypothetical protein
MITSYMVILCLSTWLFAYGLSQLAKRMVKLLGPSAAAPSALGVLLPILAFLMVVGAAPAMLLGALLLLVVQVAVGLHRGLFVRLGLPLIAGLLTAATVAMPEVMKLPPHVLVVAAAAALTLLVIAAEWMPIAIRPASMGMVLALLPLVAAPLLGAPSYIALDVAIVFSALLAGVMVVEPQAHFTQARSPLALVVGWLMLEALTHGALLPVALSLLAYAATTVYGLMRRQTKGGWVDAL